MAREMKDSGIEWFGDIPQNWDIIKIKHLFQIVAGATPKSEVPEYWDGDIVWITPADYKTEDKYITTGKRCLTSEGYNSCGTTIVPPGSIIFSKRAPIGSVAINKVPLCTNQGCLSCVKKRKASTTYIYYLMSIFPEVFTLYGSGTTFLEISADNFGNFFVPNPSVEEEERIAHFLDLKCAEIDAVIAQTQEAIEEYKALKQAVITEAVTKGVRGDRPMKDSDIAWIGEFPEDWGAKPLKYLALFQPSCDVDKLNEESEITYTPMDYIKNGYYVQNIAAYGRVAASLVPYQEGDIVMAKVTPCFENGNISIMTNLASGFGVGSSELFVFRAFAINSRFLLYWLQNDKFKQEACATMTGAGGLKRVSPYFVKHSYVLLPSENEQQEIVTYLDAKCAEIDALIFAKQRLLAELETYKKSVIYEYVTGKKEAPVCP